VKANLAQGAAALNAGDFEAAERIFRAIVEEDPAAHRAWLALSVVARYSGAPDLAVEHARRALALDRNNPEYLNTLGIAHGEQGDLHAAEQTFRRALKFNPAYAGAHHNLAKALQKQGRLDESRKEFERAYALEPGVTELQSSLCGIYRLTGRPDRALELLRAAARHRAPSPALIPQFADCLADVEGPQAALRWLRELLAHHPDSQPVHYALAFMLLAVGEWREGWKHYQWRPRSGSISPLTPERIVLRGEYGLGDVLFFLRFTTLLPKSFALALPPQLAKLAPVLRDRVELVDPADSQVWIADLPSLLETEATPPAFPLHARADGRERLARIGPPPYLGLTWRAGTDLRRAREFGVNRRVLLKEVPPTLLGQAVRGWPGTLISLQRDPADEDLFALQTSAAAPVHDVSSTNEDLRAMLAILAALDEYVAVSNTNVHLRAGLGRTARVLVPNPPEWRWMRTDGGSPWFPGFSVYRQPASRDWSAPLARLRSDLATSAGSARRAPA
jgi:Tfp pilus assembly protein PilF